MSTKNKASDEKVAEAVSYTKEQIISAKKYIHRKDVVNVVLKDGQSYTLKEVDELIEKFMKGKVK
jgi:hypothetical protein